MAISVVRLFLLVVIFIQFNCGKSLKLNSDGGYEILIGLEESTPVPSIGVASYVDNIKTSLRAFSSRLWVTTKNHFYLKSVDILVPSHWNISTALSATPQNYQSADIRLSPDATYPHAENPNVCGRPGNFLELPSSFFNVTHSGPYGLHWKSLLHAWAMYRFGVHPEHGYIGDSKFPYATKDTKSNRWTVTGCSDEPVQGKFINIANPDDTSCEGADVFGSNCRFEPSATGQNATTSLMHFHWIESVTEFCDESNHNMYAENKQNALCDYKSVWEIIRDSPDYVAVTSPRNVSVPALTFRTVEVKSKPIFYILLDQGRIQGSFSVAHNIPRILSTLLTDNVLINTVASVGAFPGNENGQVIDLVPWSELGSNRNAFLNAVGYLRNDGPLERDFSRALVEVADKIKAANHPNGVVALLIKYGADVSNFASYLPESEVINALNEGNIILNSIELNFPNHTGYSHLARISQETGGSYVTLNNFGEAETNIRNVLNYVKRTLETDYTDLKKTWKTIRKEILTSATTIPIPTDIKGPLQVFVSTFNENLSSSNFSVTAVTGSDLRDLTFRLVKSQDWNEKGSKFTYKLEIPQGQLEEIPQVNLQLSCGIASGCTGDTLTRAQVTGESQVKVELSTSLENNLADLSEGLPVSIFAKVTKNNKPVRDVTVIATLTETLSLRTTALRLLDDGALSPDAQELDGTYSAYFAPENDGQYRLSVTVQVDPSRKRATRSSSTRNLIESSFTRLLPIDQGDIGCGASSCDSETIEGNFIQTSELTSTFSVIKTSLYIPSPNKILSLLAIDNPASGQVSLYWQAPNIPGRFSTVSSYELKSAPSLEQLINNFENQTEVPVPPNFRPRPPLLMETINTERPASTTFYAIRSVYRGKKSPISNIVSIVREDNQVTTPVTTTQSSGSTTMPTSEGSTSTSNPTEGPSTPTIEPPTSTTGPSVSTGEPSSPITGSSPTSELTSPTTNPTGDPTTTSGSTPSTPAESTPSTPSETSPTTSEPTTPSAASNVKIGNSIILSFLIVVLFISANL